MSNSLQPHIFLILRAPRLGQVKTRLAKSIGDTQALTAYRALVKRQLNAIPSNWETELHYTPKDAETEIADWLGDAHKRLPQCEGDLGDRLTLAAKTHFEKSQAPLFLIGADCPEIDSDLLAKAAKHIQTDDLVIGPAKDGGYYLIGIKSFLPSLFENIDWGSPRVFEQTAQQIRKLNLTAYLLPEKFDVDTEADWKQALQRFPELNS